MKNERLKRVIDRVYKFVILPLFSIALCVVLGIVIWGFIKPQEISDSTREVESGDFYESEADKLIDKNAEQEKQNEYERQFEEDHHEELYNKPTNNNITENKIVYIAPHSGERYHLNKDCKGLEDAKSIKEMVLSEAQEEGYTLCGFEN